MTGPVIALRTLPAVQQIRTLAPGAAPRIAVVLGSGWGGLTAQVAEAVRIPYDTLDGFPPAGVPGHSGELWLGRIGAYSVAVMSGRQHAYETGSVRGMAVPLRTLRALGCEVLVQTNAAGSLRADMPPGSLMVITDHLNLPQRSPLVESTDDARPGGGNVGGNHSGADRFVDMVDAYDPALRRGARVIAERHGVVLHEGVYAWMLGPQFETPAEIRMLRTLGADAVGMSTVPETILARHAGLRVLALSLVTNLAAGLSTEVLSHAHTLAQARNAAAEAGTLLADVIAAIEL